MAAVLCSSIVALHLPFFVLLALVPSPLLAANCSSAQPIVIPVTNVTLADNIVSRGASISLGSPPQNLAFIANGHWNNTYVFDASAISIGAVGCYDVNAPNACAGSVGGFFNEQSSTTYSGASFEALHVAAEALAHHGNDVFGTDTLKINSSLSLAKFPFGVNKGKVDNVNALGVGRNSTLLNTLVSRGDIASRTYSFWDGWTGAEPQHQMDGNLVIGGYDAAKISGNNITLPFSTDSVCLEGYIVTISDIKMELPNGSSPSILGSFAGSQLRACVGPGYPIMTFPQEVWNAFVKVSGVTEVGRSLQTDFLGMLIASNTRYQGGLTISLSPGLDITIPNHQLVVPQYGYSTQGVEVDYNASTVVEVLINSLQGVDKNDMPILGRAFLSSAYLMVDADHEQFTLARVNATSAQQIVPIAPPACQSPKSIATPIPTTSTASSTTGPANVSSTPPVPAGTHQGVSTGVVAGAAVGGAAFVALCFGVLLLLRRRRRTHQQQLAQIESEKRHPPITTSSQAEFGMIKAEMPSDYTHQPPAEMPSQRHSPYQLAPYEMASQGRSPHVPAPYEM